MIIGSKHVDTSTTSTTYNIKNVFKNSAGSIGAYQVEITQTGGTTYEVFLNGDEMVAVSDNVAAAYEYIDKSTKGYYLFEVLIGGYDLEYVEKYLELANRSMTLDQLEFYIRTIKPVTIDQYCSYGKLQHIGLYANPRFELYDKYRGEYKDNVWGGTVHNNVLSDIEGFEICISGLIWIDSKTRDAQDTMRGHEYTQLIIKDNETYNKSLSKCKCLFKERFKTLEESYNEKKKY